MVYGNPFTPTFGTSPPVVGGRDHLVNQIEAALGTGPTHPAYTSLVTGERGMGKTVLLNEIEDMAHRRGWRAVDATVTDGGFIEELIEGGLELLEEVGSDQPRITGARAWALGLGAGMERSLSARRDENVRNTAFRAILKELATCLSATGSGLLITVDELHSADIAETRRFGAAIQKITRRNRQPVAFVGAGLPRLIDDLMTGDTATFLQRCHRMEVGALEITVAKQVLAETFRLGGSHLSAQPLHTAAKAGRGHPYMTQLIGYEIWNAARDPSEDLPMEAVTEGIATAQRVSVETFLAPVLEGLSERERVFLAAMLKDRTETAVSEITRRTGMSAKLVSVYRRRLIDKEAIVPKRYGYVGFADTGVRHWLADRMEENAHR